MKGRPVKDGDSAVFVCLIVGIAPSMKGRPVKDGDRGLPANPRCRVQALNERPSRKGRRRDIDSVVTGLSKIPQ